MLGARQYVDEGASGGGTVRFVVGQYAHVALPSINGKYALSFGGWMKVHEGGGVGGFATGFNWPEASGWGWTVCSPRPNEGITYAWAGTGSGISRISDGRCGALGEWHHYYLVFDGVSVKYYFDGAVDKALSFSRRWLSSNGTEFCVGYSNFYGDADEVSGPFSAAGISIFDRALSAQEVASVQAASLVDPSVAPFDSGLLAGFNCNDGHGMTMANAVAGGSPFVVSGLSCQWGEPLPEVMGG